MPALSLSSQPSDACEAHIVTPPNRFLLEGGSRGSAVAYSRKQKPRTTATTDRGLARVGGRVPDTGDFAAQHHGKDLGVACTGPSLADGTTSHTMKRADLYQAIRDQAIAQGIVVEHNKCQVDAEPAGDGVRALFEDGSDATGGC
jgi:hypothetical protein